MCIEWFTRRVLLIFVSSAALLSGSLAYSEPLPPPFRQVEFTGAGSLRAAPISILRLGSVQVRLEETTLSTVQSAAAKGDIDHQGDAGESIYWLCYTASNVRNPFRLWIVASGEMGGPEHRITEVVAERLKTGAGPTPGCPEIAAVFLPVSLDRSVWLETTRRQMHAKLGRPTSNKGDTELFLYEGSKKGPYRGPGTMEEKIVDWDVTVWFQVHVESGKIAKLRAGKVTTY